MTRSTAIAQAPQAAAAVVLIAFFALGAVLFPHFASIAVVRNLLVDNAFLGVAALGATIVILSGGIDLSIGSMMAFASILLATLIERHGMHPLAGLVVVLSAGALFGVLQGLLIGALELPAFLVTLAGMFLARGAAFAVHPQSLGIKHPFVSDTINEQLVLNLALGADSATIPPTVLVLLIMLGLTWFVLRHTRFGRSVYSVGDDAGAAALMGVPIAATRARVYAVSGTLSALAGVLFTLYQQSGDPAACKGLELDAIAATVIGGTLLRGGVGSVLGSSVGVLILGLIQTLITFQGNLSSWWTRIVVGALVLVFLLLHHALSIASRRLAG